MRKFRFVPVAAALAVAILTALGSGTVAWAQLEQFSGLGGNVGGLGPPSLTVQGVIVAAADGQPAKLVITADVPAGMNTYSITQPPGGQVRTTIKLTADPQFQIGSFQPIEPPTIHPEPQFNNLLVEEHSGTVTWVAPLALAAGVDPATLEIRGGVKAQICTNGSCFPPKDHPFTAKLGPAPTKLPDLPAMAFVASAPPPPGNVPPPPPSSVPPPPIANSSPPAPAAAGELSIGTYKPPLSHLTWNGRLELGGVAPGGKAKLLFTADMAPLWHIYAVDAPQKAGNQATLFVLDETAGFAVTAPKPDREPAKPHGAPAFPGTKLLPYFEKQVTWAIEIDVPAGTTPGEYRLAGVIGFQTCDEDSQCDPPNSVRFETTLLVGPILTLPPPTPVRFWRDAAWSYRTIRDRVLGESAPPPVGPEIAVVPTTGYDIAQIQVQSSDGASSLPLMLGIGLLAGFILNFMPCVLPVIGLKVLSFVEQGGHDRRRVFLLNVWYSLGILTVFWILATIPVVLRVGFGMQFGWGQQFSYDGFNITLVAIVFVMALSFLGVWEIPIPGFAGGGGAQKAASKEGAIGAFVKGMITTVLATPCSGPFLGTAVAFAFGSSPLVAYAMFTAMGLGMAAPYLLIGLNPGWVKVLPRPGEWMDTFKQLMGFVLIGTVLWLMLPIDAALLMPTLVLLAGLSAACWWIGQTPGYAELPQKLKAWTQAVLFAGVIGWLAFAMPQVTDPLPWKHFKMADFVRDVNDGKTVLVEFTADWCATCKALKAANLDRSKTKARIAANGVLVYEMNVDEASEEEQAFFRRMQPAGSVPLVAIFPAEKKYEPIRFGDGYTQGQILEALDAAGPSKRDAAVANRTGDDAKVGIQ